MLTDETDVTRSAMPGLAETISARGLMQLEGGGGEILAGLFREHGKPAFLVPRHLGGSGGSLVDLAHVLRLVGARCPSLSIMMTMHHHSVGGFARGSIPMRAGARLIEQVVEQRALVASAFAEGRPGADILDSTVECTKLAAGAGFRLAGSKKPCSMTHSASLAVVGVAVDHGGGEKARGIALVETGSAGVRTEKFWPAEIFASSDSHCIVFDDVIVAADRVLAPQAGGSAGGRDRLAVAHAEIALSCLFQLMVSASYIGMASRLCEMVLRRRAGTPNGRVEILSQLEAAAMAVYRLAGELEQGDFSGYHLARAMLVAYNAGSQIERAVTASAKLLGGGAYLGSREAQYLVLASRCISFHPPSAAVREDVIDGCYTELASGNEHQA